MDDGVEPKVVVDAIDRRFEKSADPTRSLSEDEWSRQLAKQLGDVGLIATVILAAVFFTMLLLTANVAALAFGEGVADLAVMKALGFKNGTLSGPGAAGAAAPPGLRVPRSASGPTRG